MQSLLDSLQMPALPGQCQHLFELLFSFSDIRSCAVNRQPTLLQALQGTLGDLSIKALLSDKDGSSLHLSYEAGGAGASLHIYGVRYT